MSITAVYPSALLFPGAATYPATPGTYDGRPTLTGSDGTAVPVLAVLAVSEHAASNTIIHARPHGDPLVDVRPWTPPTLTLTLLIDDYATFKALRRMYAAGATVTLRDAGNPWDGLTHKAAGTISYRSITRPSAPARLEASLDVIEVSS